MQRLSGNRIASLRGRQLGARRTKHGSKVAKDAGGAVCRICGVERRHGHWSWPATEPGQAAGNAVCPACRRIREGRPAHELRCRGLPPTTGRELAALVRRVAAAETRQHPLERLLSLRQRGGVLAVATTGPYLARRLLEALRQAGRAHLSVQRGRARTELVWSPTALPTGER